MTVKYSYSDIASVRFDGNGETSIYPNPASSEVTITTKEPTSLQIMDLYGRVLSKQDISEGQSTINLSTLPTGILILRLETRDLRF
ncbi:MAG: T9SS type A sorting domain-containing protein [Saprospiraceae bacterium]|nr:T9SS type A sorting domain-containing protein [Saprospiraceae bacterium]